MTCIIKGANDFRNGSKLARSFVVATDRFNVPLAANKYNLFGEYITSFSLKMDQASRGNSLLTRHHLLSQLYI
jgi:hypothetical protein